MPIPSYIVPVLAFATAALVSFGATPPVRRLAFRIGAIDTPRDSRRMHSKPIPRIGGLAVYLGFIAAVLLFIPVNTQLRGILLGSVIIVAMAAVDDTLHDKGGLSPRLRLILQVTAALVPVLHGVRVDVLTNFNLFSGEPYFALGMFSIPVTVLWIVGMTNAVNWIDGLDGLSCGISTISAFFMFIIAMVLQDNMAAGVMAALAGACVGFLPYNLNPARIFIGDTGAMFLGFMLATMSIVGLFKFYAVVSFAVPFLILGIPIFDAAMAMLRRILSGKNPMHADRSHIHHQLIDMGFSQKQAVALLYTISGILGLAAVVVTTSGEVKAMILIIALIFTGMIALRLFRQNEDKDRDDIEQNPQDKEEKELTGQIMIEEIRSAAHQIEEKESGVEDDNE